MKFLSQFPSLSYPSMRSRIPDPTDEKYFTRASSIYPNGMCIAKLTLHRDLLKLRREALVFDGNGRRVSTQPFKMMKLSCLDSLATE